jgi:hypothetical protein
MSFSMLHFSPAVLTAFMLLLALVPLVLAWQDSRRDAARSRRVRTLRREAQVSAELRERSAGPMPDGLMPGWSGAGRR